MRIRTEEQKAKEREYALKSYRKNLSRSRAMANARYQRNKEQYRLSNRKRQISYTNSWSEYLPEKANCGVCGKELFYRGTGKNDTIHFDHTQEECAIKTNPSNFLMSRKCTPENIKIWESCNFGILCHWCNLYIPTKNRKEWLSKVTAYINK